MRAARHLAALLAAAATLATVSTARAQATGTLDRTRHRQDGRRARGGDGRGDRPRVEERDHGRNRRLPDHRPRRPARTSSWSTARGSRRSPRTTWRSPRARPPRSTPRWSWPRSRRRRPWRARPRSAWTPARARAAIVLKGDDLEALPDDPDELAEALQALAGPSAGPSGGQIFIDGFSSGRLPPKESIREIRLNTNPFSAEHDRLGFGRIEILTKPGTDRLRGSTSFEFMDESLNSRNPYARNEAPYQRREWDGSLGGPLSKKASFFVDFARRDIDDNEIVNATVLDALPRPRGAEPGPAGAAAPHHGQPAPRLPARGQAHAGRAVLVHGVGARGRGHRRLLAALAGLRHVEPPAPAPGRRRPRSSATRWSTRRACRSRATAPDQVGDNTIPTLQVQEAFTGGGSQVGDSLERHRPLRAAQRHDLGARQTRAARGRCGCAPRARWTSPRTTSGARSRSAAGSGRCSTRTTSSCSGRTGSRCRPPSRAWSATAARCCSRRWA